jgi:hypothetical protein
MNTLRALFALAFLAGMPALNAQQTQSLRFESTRIDLGTIKKSQGPITCTFVFRNVNAEKVPVGIVEMQPLCECISAVAPEAPVKHWELGEIKVTYDPSKLPAGAFENSLYVISDAWETHNYHLFVTGTLIDDVSEGTKGWLTVEDLKASEGVLQQHEMQLGFDVVFIDTTEAGFRKFAREVGRLVKAKGGAEVLVEACTSKAASKKFPEKVKVAEERMTETLRLLVSVLRTEGVDDAKVRFVSSAFVDGPDVEEEGGKAEASHLGYEYVRLKLREIKP